MHGFEQFAGVRFVDDDGDRGEAPEGGELLTPR
jgi:hypothetical protein